MARRTRSSRWSAQRSWPADLRGRRGQRGTRRRAGESSIGGTGDGRAVRRPAGGRQGRRQRRSAASATTAWPRQGHRTVEDCRYSGRNDGCGRRGRWTRRGGTCECTGTTRGRRSGGDGRQGTCRGARGWSRELRRCERRFTSARPGGARRSCPRVRGTKGVGVRRWAALRRRTIGRPRVCRRSWTELGCCGGGSVR